MVTITSVEARKKFGQLMDMAQREPVAKATKRARRAAAKLTDEEVTRLVHENSELGEWKARLRG
jgi:hypothetical protein